MKTIKRSLSLAAVLVLALTLLCACAGENRIVGNWQYNAKITSAGDEDSVFHFAQDGKFYLESSYGVNYGTYRILRGGTDGSFITTVEGIDTQYFYRLDGDTMVITTVTGYSMELTRIS